MVDTKRNLSSKQLEKVANVLKAIAHPIRLEVLKVLEQEEPLMVSDIRAKIEMEVEQSLLSHHLIKMKDKGIVCSVKKGKYIYYNICDRHILNIFNCMERCSFVH
ncbi:MAG: ArsR/SmtB family transcription factor [Chitinophagales bacterium]